MFGELRQILRAVGRAPGFLAVGASLVAVGSGVTGAAFATARGWFSLESVIPDASHLVVIAPRRDFTVEPTGYFRKSSFDRLAALGTFNTVAELFGTAPQRVVLSMGRESLTVRMEAVTAHYFAALRVSPLLGRSLGVADEGSAGWFPIVLGQSAWQRLFRGDPQVVGRTVRVADIPATIVGVMPGVVRGFTVPTSTAVDIWAPLSILRTTQPPKNVDAAVWVQVFGRLADDASVDEAQAEFSARTSAFDSEDPKLGISVLPVERGVISTRARIGTIAMGSAMVGFAALVLLISCANLINLLLARTTIATSEIAVRMALGATPSDIIRRQLLESGCITALGASLGFLAVVAAARLVGRFTLFHSGGSVATGEMIVDPWVAGFFLLLCLLASLIVGLMPAMRAVRCDPAQVLASGGSRGRTTGRFERMQTALVASQIAGATVLLVLGALFGQSAVRVANYRVSFDAANIALGFFDFGTSHWTEAQGRLHQAEVLDAAGAIPGVSAASISTALPAEGDGELADVEALDGTGNLACHVISASPGFFGVMQLAPVRGRLPAETDGQAQVPVAVVTSTAADRLWPGQDPLGRRIRIRRGEWLSVVGIVPDSDRTATNIVDRSYVFLPFAQRYESRFMLAVRGTLPGSSLVTSFMNTMRAGPADTSMFNARTAQSHLENLAGPVRSMAMGLIVLAACGVLIAVVGVYAVMAYLVGLRRVEFGVRKALGATDWAIAAQVGRQAVWMIALGLILGIPVAYVVSSWSAGELVGTTAHDAVTYVLVAAGLFGVGLLATWLPVRRALSGEPADILKTI